MAALKQRLRSMVGADPGPPLPPGDREKAAAQLKANLVGEHQNITHRLQWNLTSQGFLFAAYAVVLTDQVAHQADIRFRIAISLVGLLLSLMTLVGVIAAYRGINASKRIWLGSESDFQQCGVRPFADPGTSLLGRIPAIISPAAVGGAWCFLLLSQ